MPQCWWRCIRASRQAITPTNLIFSTKYLVALDDHRHFGRAALVCHVRQPALSNALRALEKGLSISTVKPGRNFAGFSVGGEALTRHRSMLA